jgi:hypothetical protein
VALPRPTAGGGADGPGRLRRVFFSPVAGPGVIDVRLTSGAEGENGGIGNNDDVDDDGRRQVGGDSVGKGDKNSSDNNNKRRKDDVVLGPVETGGEARTASDGPPSAKRARCRTGEGGPPR